MNLAIINILTSLISTKFYEELIICNERISTFNIYFQRQCIFDIIINLTTKMITHFVEDFDITFRIFYNDYIKIL